jgi:hypothetical protein
MSSRLQPVRICRRFPSDRSRMTQHPSSSRNQSRGGLALRPGMMASLTCGLHAAWSDPCPQLWRFQESQRPQPFATMTMSMDRVEKTRQQPRQESSLRPRPTGRDRAVLSRERACRSYALACGRGTDEIRCSAAPSRYAKSALWEALGPRLVWQSAASECKSDD